MAPSQLHQPASWSASEFNRTRQPSDPRMSITFDDDDPPSHRSQHSHGDHLRPSDGQHDVEQNLRRRRSSLSQRVEALRSAGGYNSIDNFARSWQRAAGFYEIAHTRPSFRYAKSDEDEDGTTHGTSESHAPPTSLLRAQLANSSQILEEHALDDGESTSPMALSRHASRDLSGTERQPLLSKHSSSALHDDNIFRIEPSLASPFGGSYGSTWGSLASRVNEPSMRHAGRLFREQQMKGITEPDKEREPLLVRQVQEDDGKVVNVVVGQSTLPQTIFNSVNVLVGVGLLSLPLAIRYAGWVAGIFFLVFCALSTSYTAKLLAKCADVDSSLITFADLAYVSFGRSTRVFVSILFCVELIGACVALVVLFADSLDALIPGWGLMEWKFVCGLILLPLGFVPLRYLSFTSILGILCCLLIVVAVLLDGLIKPHQPGSLREPAATYLFPANWATLPISLGLLIAPWGGHAVFPNIYRDMRHPYKYRHSVDITYIFTFLLDLLMSVIGVLMFGDGVADEITKNIVDEANGFPRWISVCVIVCVAIIPLTKVPLNARPIITTIEISLGLDDRAMASSPSLTGMSGLTRGILRITVRVICTALFVFLAVLIPEFDRIMSLIGSVAGFAICIVLPCSFHLKLFGKELSGWQKTLDWSLIISTSCLAVLGTAFNFVPKEKLGL